MITKLGRIMGENWEGAMEASGYLSEDAAQRFLDPIARRKSQEPRTPWYKAIGYGAGIGAGVGGATSILQRAVGGYPWRFGRSTAIGTAIGLLSGAMSKNKDDLQIEDATDYLSEGEEDRLWRRAQERALLLRKIQNNPVHNTP